METSILKVYEDIFKRFPISGKVLEVGAVPTEFSLLNLEAFGPCDTRIGINLDGGKSYMVGGQNLRHAFELRTLNANDMSGFEDSSFDCIVSNSVFEHDKYFWKSLAEIRRVAKPGALIVIGTPGYDKPENIQISRKKHRLGRWLAKRSRGLFAGTPTLHIHNWPGDYYRFSPQAYREIIFEGMEVEELHSVEWPPRIIGVARLPKA